MSSTLKPTMVRDGARRDWRKLTRRPIFERQSPPVFVEKPRWFLGNFLVSSPLLWGVGVMTSLIPQAFYWARSHKHARGRATVVQVSTIFGDEPDYWTLAVAGSDQHHMIDDFEIIAPVDLFDAVAAELKIAAE